MKCLLLTSLFLVTTFSFAAGQEKMAKRYMKKLGLSKEEMYHTTKQVIAPKYAKNGELNFPNNHLYDGKGQEVMAQYGQRQVPMLDCFSAMVRDLNRYLNDTGGVVYTTVNTTLQQEQSYFKPVYAQADRKPAMHNLVIYYPAGSPLIKKYYSDLSRQIKEYRANGRDIAIYFVLVPLK